MPLVGPYPFSLPLLHPSFLSSPIGTCHCGYEHGWTHVIKHQLLHWKAFTDTQCYWSNMHSTSSLPCFSNLKTISTGLSKLAFFAIKRGLQSSGESGKYVKKLIEDDTLRMLEWFAQIKGLSTESANLVHLKKWTHLIMPPDPYEFRNKEFSYRTDSHRHVFQV